MNKQQLTDAATLIDRVVSSLCDLLDFEEGDSTDKDLNALAEVAMRLREMARS
jgi:hypothetical protein